MQDLTGMFAIFCIFVAPLWLIMHYGAQRRRTQGLTGEDEKMLADLWQIANRMEARVKALETILDTQAPKWRDKT